MHLTRRRSRGFALIACLLLLLLLSEISIGLLLMVNTETRVGANDLQNNVAYHAAEGAIEKMTSDLASVYTSIQAPQPSDIEALNSLKPPDSPLVKITYYNISFDTDSDGTLKTKWGTIKTGPNAGLNAQIFPVTLTATAESGFGNQVSMIRTAEMALIPVFQFGVFSNSDLGFFSSPDLDFNGRVHTNGDLYLGVASGSTITFHDKITAYGNVIRKVLPNGLDGTSYNDNGKVKILSAAGGCDSGQPNCKTLAQNQGSVVQGPKSAQNPLWNSVSKGTFNGWIIDGNYGRTGGTGATCLSLPFTGGSQSCPTDSGQAPSYRGPQPYEIIRRPPADESATSAVGQARLYNEAEIRILLSDDPSELPGGATDAQNIRLANVKTNSAAPDYSNGVPTPVASAMPVLPPSQYYVTFFAEASVGIQDSSDWQNDYRQQCLRSDWSIVPATYGPSDSLGRLTLMNYETKPYDTSTTPTSPMFAGDYAPYNNQASGQSDPACFVTSNQVSTMKPPPTPNAPANPKSWNLIDGYLRVEYRDAGGGNWFPVTKEWLELGFARDTNPPVVAGSNPVHPNAILIFQEIADRDGDGSIDAVGGQQKCNSSGTKCGIPKPKEVQLDPATSNSYYYSLYDSNDPGNSTVITKTNWYPINFYDAREGEVRDNLTSQPSGSCAANGVMNAVELDVGNLRRWLLGDIGTSGRNVNWVASNGYILYFSDRRGMLPPDPANPTVKYGEYGFEDVVNTASGTVGTPDAALEPPSTNSPEDVNGNGKIDFYGARNLGLGFGVNGSINASSTRPDPYARIANCVSASRKNWVSGARHVLRLVDGTLGNLPTKPDGSGGFTVASENPVYVLKDYNSNGTGDPTWADPSASEPPHAAASIIADAVTALSNNWSDVKSLQSPFHATGNRPASTTYYRVAIAAGKNKAFPAPSYTQTGSLYGFGTDGGLHNFLRFLEDWSNDKLYYKGSLVSLYYSTYATGTFKCCNDAVYHPPDRNYVFDPLFAQPENLPPGTPMFRDVNNLSYRQDFTPR